MKTILLVFLLFHSKAIFLQNLVPNPSFEEYDTCPSLEHESDIFDYVNNWQKVTQMATPDYFNSCSPFFGVPNNNAFFSYQNAKTGVGFAGLYTYKLGLEYREYLQVKLIDTLLINNCYKIEFYVNLSDSILYATNNLGGYLSSNDVNTTSTNFVLNLIPQIKLFRNRIINDTLNWTKIQAIYESQGDESFLTIGNFNFDNETDTLNIGHTTFPGNIEASYYFIDDVSVISLNPSTMPANAGADKLVAPGDSVFIGQEITNLNCTWRSLDGTVIGTNTSGLYVQPTQTTTYVVEQNLCGTITYDTVKVSVGYLNLAPQTKVLEVSGVRISPNPNSGTFTIELTKTIDAQEILIIDEVGRIVKILDKKTNKHYLDLPKGVYFLEVKSKENRFCEKIVVN